MISDERMTEIRKKLQDLLDECMASNNQEGSLNIVHMVADNDGQGGNGTISFSWLICEGEPYFQGY